MSSRDLPESDSGSVLSPAERRRTERYPFSAAVELTEAQSGARVSGRTSDLGLGGCYIDMLNPFPIGTEVKVRILKGNESFEAHAKVTFSQNGMGMGVAFTAAQPSQVRTFQKWMQEINPTPPVEAANSAESASTGNSQTQSSAALSELILTLMKKQVLSDAEGKELLRKLFQ
jgi:PilZ domain-containing protein